MYGFWAIVILIGILNRAFALAVQYRQRRLCRDPEASNERRLPSKSALGGARRWIKRYITLPATFGYRHQQAFGWCTVPKRITAFLVFAFVVINILLTSVRYRAFKRNI